MDTIELRQRFLVEFVTNRHLYEDEDAKRVRECDFWVKRFIAYKGQGANAAYYHMKDCFSWRKTFGLYTFDPLRIPREIWSLGPLFAYEPDREGTIPIIMRSKMLVRVDLLEEEMKRAFVALMDKVDNEVRRPNGWSFIFDCSGAGIENANFDLMFFALSTLKRCFPLGPKYAALYAIPWIYKSFVKYGLSILPPEAVEKIRFIDTPEELQRLVAPENLPDFMGGTCPRSYTDVPPGARGCIELGKELYGLSEEQVKVMMEPITQFGEEKARGKGSGGGTTEGETPAADEYTFEEFD